MLDPLEPPRQLDDVLADLDAVVELAYREHTALGIFPAMYRSVTAAIHDAVEADFFDHSPKIERLAVTFADRYLDAYGDLTAGRTPTMCWDVAFRAAMDGRRRMIAQHLFAGMNAHINLDLGIVTAIVAGTTPEELYPDFLRVNHILFAKVNGLQDCLGSVSPRMAWIDRLGGRLDERLMRVTIREARDRAWDLALALLEDPARSRETIANRDRDTARLGRTILGGRLHVRLLARFVAATEPVDVRPVIEAFRDRTIDLDTVEDAVRATTLEQTPDRGD